MCRRPVRAPTSLLIEHFCFFSRAPRGNLLSSYRSSLRPTPCLDTPPNGPSFGNNFILHVSDTCNATAGNYVKDVQCGDYLFPNGMQPSYLFGCSTFQVKDIYVFKVVSEVPPDPIDDFGIEVAFPKAESSWQNVSLSGFDASISCALEKERDLIYEDEEELVALERRFPRRRI